MISALTDTANEIRGQLRSSKNSISDDNQTFSFRECQRAVNNLTGYSGSIAALTLKNSLPHAINVINCFVKNISFLVLNGSINITPSAESFSTFCRDIVSPSSASLNPFFQGESNCFGAEEAYMVLRTSGTTNTPKFVLHSQKRVLQNSKRSVDRLGLNADDRVLIPVSIHHSYGLVTAFVPSLIAGCSIRFVSDYNVIKVIEAIKQFKPTVLFATPGLIEMLMRIRTKFNIPKVTITAGDRIREEIFAGYDQEIGTLLNLYGSTEMGAMATSDPERDRGHRAKGGVIAIPGIDFSLKYVGNGPGTIHCTHDSGYLHYLDYTGKRISETNNIFDTKDLGTEVDGEIRIHGRSDHKINRNGILISFFEIENAIESTCNELKKVIVVRTQGQDIIGTQFAAICELNEFNSVDVDFIKKACKAKLGKNMQPDRIEIIEALPLLPNGKVDRKALQSKYC